MLMEEEGGEPVTFLVGESREKDMSISLFFTSCNLVTCLTITQLRLDRFPILIDFKNKDIQFASNL